MNPHYQPQQPPNSSQVQQASSNEFMARRQNPSTHNEHQRDLRYCSEQSTKIDQFDQPSKESSKGETSEAQYFSNNSSMNVLPNFNSNFQTIEPTTTSNLHQDYYQRQSMMQSYYSNHINFPKKLIEEQNCQCRECAYYHQMNQPTEHVQSQYIQMFQHQRRSTNQLGEQFSVNDFLYPAEQVIGQQQEKLEYEEPISDNYRKIPNEIRYIQGQSQFHHRPHQQQQQQQYFQNQMQFQNVPQFQKYPSQPYPANIPCQQTFQSYSPCQQSCNCGCGEENTYQQHPNLFYQHCNKQPKYPSNCIPFIQGDLSNTYNNPSHIISNEKLEKQEDSQGINLNYCKQEIQQKIEYQEDDEEDAATDEEENEEENNLSENNPSSTSNEKQQQHNNNSHQSQPSVSNNKTLITHQSKLQMQRKIQLLASNKSTEEDVIRKRLNTKDREYGVLEELKTKKEIGKLKQFHNHLKVFMLQSCKYIHDQLLKDQTNELDSSNSNNNNSANYNFNTSYSALQLKQHIQYLHHFKHRFQKSDLAYFLKNTEEISMNELHDIMNIKPIKSRLIAQRRIVYLFIIISSFASNQLISCMFSQSDCQNNSTNHKKSSSLQDQQLLQGNPETFIPKVMSSCHSLPEEENNKKLSYFKNMTQTNLIEHLLSHPQTLELMNSYVPTVNTFNRTNRSLIMHLCLFSLGKKACMKKAMKFNQFYTKNYIIQTLLIPNIIE